ncbi:MAG: Fic family protein [Bacteroidia bacterium]
MKNNFDTRISTPNPQIVGLLARIDEIKGEFKGGLRMAPQAITNLRKSVIVTSTGASTRIEGSKLTDAEVEQIMRGVTTSKFAERDGQEVQGYLEVLQNIFDSPNALPIREGVIKALHKELLKYSKKDALHKGEYKKEENIVAVADEKGNPTQIIFKTTRAYLVQKEMNELVDWTADAFEKAQFHPLLILGNFLVEFLKIHPFKDGNGRLSRVLTNLILLQQGYQFVQYVSHEQIIEKRKAEYYLALRRSQSTFATENETIEPWITFFFSVIHEQATKALIYLESEKLEDILSPKQLEVWNFISQNNEIAPSEITKATGIGMPTVRQGLERLEKLGKIKRLGNGRASRYLRL